MITFGSPFQSDIGFFYDEPGKYCGVRDLVITLFLQECCHDEVIEVH